jgi:hypothetical protein
LALEAERDDEALASGVAEDDLAEAILIAARLHRHNAAAPYAYAAGGGEGVAWRVRRLLCATERRRAPPRTLWAVPAACVGLLASALWLGMVCGDAVLDALPGIGP